jgi:glucose-6-phosphate dehydrogenase assembly protein OpcA
VSLSAVLTGESQPLDPHRIGSTLTGVWKEFQKTCADGNCMRLCSHNLLIVCSGPDRAAQVQRDLDELLPNYPGRAVVVTLDPAHSGPVQGDFRVFTRRRHLAGELVRLRFPADAPPLPSMVAPLWQDGLPMVLLWRGEPAYGTNWFQQLIENCTRFVVDTDFRPKETLGACVQPLAALWKLMRDPYLATHGFMDFSWGRLQVWRDWIASLFDRPDRRRLLPLVECIELENWAVPGATVPGLSSLYLSAWLVYHLKLPIVQKLSPIAGGHEARFGNVNFRFYSRSTDDEDMLGRPVRVTFRGSRDGQPFRLSVERDSTECSTLVLGGSGPCAPGSGHTLHLERMQTLTLLGQELETDGRDRQFERVLETLLRMTGAAADA